MAAVMSHSERTGAVVLAEGIETSSHLEQALALGATLGQGWAVGLPGPFLVSPAPFPAIALARDSPPIATTPFEVVALLDGVRVGRKGFVARLVAPHRKPGPAFESRSRGTRARSRQQSGSRRPQPHATRSWPSGVRWSPRSPWAWRSSRRSVCNRCRSRPTIRWRPSGRSRRSGRTTRPHWSRTRPRRQRPRPRPSIRVRRHPRPRDRPGSRPVVDVTTHAEHSHTELPPATDRACCNQRVRPRRSHRTVF